MRVRFLGQPKIWTRQILLGFHPSVQITSQFMSRLRTTSLHGKSKWSEYFSRSYWKFGWEWLGYIQHMAYLASWCPRRCSKINTVPRQSFVIHPNSGWWQSTSSKEEGLENGVSAIFFPTGRPQARNLEPWTSLQNWCFHVLFWLKVHSHNWGPLPHNWRYTSSILKPLFSQGS
jgi:hypothetical protein